MFVAGTHFAPSGFPTYFGVTSRSEWHGRVVQPWARPALPEGVSAPSSTASPQTRRRQLHGAAPREVSALSLRPSFLFSLPSLSRSHLPSALPSGAAPAPRASASCSPRARAPITDAWSGREPGARALPLPFPAHPRSGGGTESRPQPITGKRAWSVRRERARVPRRRIKGGRARARGSLAAGADGGGTHASCRPRPPLQRPPRPPRAAPWKPSSATATPTRPRSGFSLAAGPLRPGSRPHRWLTPSPRGRIPPRRAEAVASRPRPRRCLRRSRRSRRRSTPGRGAGRICGARSSCRGPGGGCGRSSCASAPSGQRGGGGGPSRGRGRGRAAGPSRPRRGKRGAPSLI